MKKVKQISIAVIMAFLLLSHNFYLAQSCGQSVVTENWFKTHPEGKAKFEQEQSKPTEINSKNMSAPNLVVPTHTIPMVFHILHLGGAENISDAQISDQMKILNRDFQKLNADTLAIVPGFTNNIANVGFAFELAKIDPDGNCTNGIIRHYTTKTNWDANDMSWFTYTWPRNKYLNVYIVKTMNIAATAYAFLPGTPIPPAADVIVSIHNVCGSIGTSAVGNSRTLTHEVGHWFNLQHIWGSSNQPGVACGDDQVSDTPITKGFSVCTTPNNAYVCFPTILENIQNYMDYTPCKIMYTNGQKARMLAMISSTVNGRNNISTASNLLATGVTSSTTNCIPLVEVSVVPTQTICAGTSLIINSYTSNANVISYSWTANNGATILNPTATNANITLNNTGNSTITCYAINANGSGSASIVVTALNNSVQVTTTNAESFETAGLPVNWQVINPTTPSTLWEITNVSGSDGSQSIFVNGENASGDTEEILQTPSYDFLNNPGSIFTFKYAYARQTATHNDVFKVQASKDCGGSWSDIYVPTASAMASGSGGVSSTIFVPSANQWKLYDLTQHPNFGPFLNQTNVLIRFYFKEDPSGFGNRIYLDQINFDVFTGVNEFTRSISLNLYPNPAKNEFTIDFNLSEDKQVKLSVTTVTGVKVYEAAEKNYSAGNNKISFQDQRSLATGIYLVNIEFNGLKVVKKLVIE